MGKFEPFLYYCIGIIGGYIGSVFYLSFVTGHTELSDTLKYPHVTFVFILVSILIVLQYINILNSAKRSKEEKARQETILMMAHQMRTGLTSVRWGIEEYMDDHRDQMSEDDKNSLLDINNTIHNTVILTVSLLDIAKFDIGKLGLTMQILNMESLKKRFVYSMKRFEYGTKQNGINFISNIDLDSSKSIACDIDRLTVVLENLIENAINYVGKDNKRVEVNITNSDKCLFLSVKDSGIGIPASEQEFIFTKFYRASNAIRELSIGTGVGLFLCKEYVEAHKGKITFSSNEDNGTTFTIEIPLNENIKIEESILKI